MKEKALAGSLGSLTLHEDTLALPLREALRRIGGVVRVEVPGEMPHWLVETCREKHILGERGAPVARIWTLRELESFPWSADHYIGLGNCVRAFQSPARRGPSTNMGHA